MKAVKASEVINGDTGVICYLTIEEVIVLKWMTKKVNGDSNTTARRFSKAYNQCISDVGIFLNGPDLFTGNLIPTENSLAKVQENVDAI